MIYVVSEPHFQGQRIEGKDWMILEVKPNVPCRQHEGMLQTFRDGKWSTAGSCVGHAASWPHLVQLLLSTPELTIAMVQMSVYIVASAEAYGNAPIPEQQFRYSGGTDEAKTA